MKLYFKNISLLLLTFTLVFSSCQVEESLQITKPAPALVLETPGITSVFLNFSLPDNPAFTVTWKDNLTQSSSYSVEMSTNEAFSNPAVLGTTDKKSFSMSVKNFNTAITNAVNNSFKDIAVYVRIKAGATTSNSILLLVTTYPVTAPAFDGVKDGDSFVLNKANKDQVALSLKWTDPVLNSGLGVKVAYTIEASSPTANFSPAIEVAKVSNANTFDIITSKLNAIALESGIAPDTKGDLKLRIKSVITDSSNNTLERINTPITIAVTTYKTVLDLSSTWGIVGAVTNWGGKPDFPFWKTNTNGVFNAYVTLPVGEIKFRENMAWANNYGDNGADGSLEAGGANINVTEAGSYKVTMDLNNLTYKLEKFSIGIVGSAYNNWGATPDFMLTYDQYSDVFRGIAKLQAGEMKFRMNNDWAVNYGDNGADGSLEAGGANINVTAGYYIVTVNLNDKTYTLEKIDHVWGLVGSAYNNWGATPDAQFTRDWSNPFDNIWILRNVDLLNGEYKIRANNDWAVNYGDNGADGTLEAGGANIKATAGNYTITLDFTNASSPTYKVVKN